MRSKTVSIVAAFLALGQTAALAIVEWRDGGVHTLDYVLDDHLEVWLSTTAHIVAGGQADSLCVDDLGVVNLSGGRILGDVSAGPAGQFTMLDGVVGGHLLAGGECQMYGGTINGGVGAEWGGQFHMYGGTVNRRVSAHAEADVYINGGLLNDGMYVSQSYAAICGGEIFDTIWLCQGTMEISGGSIRGRLGIGSGGFPQDQGMILYGSRFRINGLPAHPGTYYADDYPEGTLSGILDSGDVIDTIFTICWEESYPLGLTLVGPDWPRVPAPGAALLGLIGLGFCSRWRGRRTST